MSSAIFKEIMIGLLLCLAILAVLAVLLYSYIPNNKVVPEPVAYSIPEEAKEIIQEAEVDESKVILTYEVNSSDLSTAQKTNNYNPGKVDPFSTYQVQEAQPEGSSSNGTSGSGTDNASTTNSGTSNSTNPNDKTTNNGSSKSSTNEGTYFKNKGTK